jgi:TrmH family RNA methyltransferase
LLADRAARDAEGVFVVESLTLLHDAIRAGDVREVFVMGNVSVDVAAPLHHLAAGVLERVATTVSPQPVLAVVAQRKSALASLTGSGPIVVCVEVRDPGNLGTILRSAEAGGACGVVCCDGTVDVYNPKCVRGSAGAVMRIPVVVGGDPVTVLRDLGAAGRRRYAAAAGAGESYETTDLAGSIAFVVGNESAGLPSSLADVVDATIHIPMAGGTESLNVGVASAVLCFEAARQRRARQ